MDVLYGKNPAIEVINSKSIISKIYLEKGSKTEKLIKEKLSISRSNVQIDIEYCEKQKLDELAKYKNHQGVVLIKPSFSYSSLDKILNKNGDKGKLILVLDGITDQRNLGAIIRTANFFACNGVVISKDRSAEVSDLVWKTSSGALEYMPIVRVTNIVVALKELKNNGFWIYGTDSNQKNSIFDVNFDTKNIAVVIGSEGKGMRRLVKENCDFIVTIPALGKLASLNVGVATGIMLYEIQKQLVKFNYQKTI